jgi:protein-disulfide isomerase
MADDRQVGVGTRYRLLLDTARTVAIVTVSAVLVWVLLSGDLGLATSGRPVAPSAPQPRPEPPLPKAPVTLDGAWLEGSGAAKVVLIEYSDFECPFCSRFTKTTLADIRSRYVKSGQVQIAFRHFPLVQIHSKAMKAAQAAECAGAQGKFWLLHDAMFEDPSRLDEADLIEKARGLGLDEKQLGGCINGMAAKVNGEISAAKALEISGTPTILLGLRRSDGRVDIKRRITGAVPIGQVAPIVDSLLATS